MWKPGRSLRATVRRWFTATSALGLLVLGASLLLVAGHGSARAEQDEHLAAAADEVIAGLLARAASPPDEPLEARLPAGAKDGFCALRAENGQVLRARNVRAEERLPAPAAAPGSGPLHAAFESLDASRARDLTGQDETLRAITAPFRDRDRLYFLQLAEPERRWSASLGPGLMLFALGALALALVSRLAVRRIVGDLLAPLRGLADFAGKLSPSDPGQRFHAPEGDLELRRLEQELNAALLRMEEAIRSQAQFASNVAHELRSPIAALMAEAQVSRLGRRNPRQSRAFMDRVEEELRHLSELVESFLVMAQVEARASRRDLVHFDDVIRRAMSRCAPLATKSEVELVTFLAESSPDCDPFVLGDAQLLLAMVENLVRNAIHHSPRGAAVRVSTRCAQGTLKIAVEDRGPGIPEELRQAVFERGVRTPAEGLLYNGAGLGLSIVSNVVQLHGGSVSIETIEGGGCSFVVTLPAVSRS